MIFVAHMPAVPATQTGMARLVFHVARVGYVNILGNILHGVSVLLLVPQMTFVVRTMILVVMVLSAKNIRTLVTVCLMMVQSKIR